ncbi:SDR family oxidoreductase [Actinoallomurus rhizosphaericola]|uniref:SDR family oxidoreductase n=1 Tax=Actinoallomurus rhizosphaericola TaxID=2952536 RepID=UPI0020931FCF|nr:sugar nucleotide-binding protein [Actinoallomurus rhizosphaericola]MCO5996990.1 sugar nucleotide-binding protein [Actinoallomurus rhizosphaericola]
MVVGSGYLGGHIGARIRALGGEAVLCSRRPPAARSAAGLRWYELDVRDPRACRDLVRRVAPDSLVVVHGPSDITWCERHPDEAMAAHGAGAVNLAAAAGGLPVLLISTDNVFPGARDSYGESDEVAPANAYGRAKLSAERTLLDTGSALVLRVSLVYGWDPDGHRPNYFTTCVRALRAGRVVEAPEDHWNTPVLVDDVAAWSAELVRTRRTGVLHLAGPERLSRYAWARRIAAGLGLPEGLVRPVAQAGTAYACRPRNACLHSERAAGLPELAGLWPVDVDEGARRLAPVAFAAGGPPVVPAPRPVKE